MNSRKTKNTYFVPHKHAFLIDPTNTCNASKTSIWPTNRGVHPAQTGP